MPDLDGSMQARRLRRTTFMKAVYDATGGSEVQFVDGPSLGDAFSWPRPETDDIIKGVMLTRGGAVVHPSFLPSQAA